MKTTLVLAGLLTLLDPAAARADATAYYDVTKVHTDCSECKAATEALKADETKWMDEVGRAGAEAQKSDAACAKFSKEHPQLANVIPAPKECADAQAKDQRRQQLLAKYQQDDQQRAAQNSQRIDARVKRILPALAKARHLSAILAIGDINYAAPQVDLTAEIVRRLDAGEGNGEDELRAELAKARAELAAAKAKPEPPKK